MNNQSVVLNTFVRKRKFVGYFIYGSDGKKKKDLFYLQNRICPKTKYFFSFSQSWLIRVLQQYFIHILAPAHHHSIECNIRRIYGMVHSGFIEITYFPTSSKCSVYITQTKCAYYNNTNTRFSIHIYNICVRTYYSIKSVSKTNPPGRVE